MCGLTRGLTDSSLYISGTLFERDPIQMDTPEEKKKERMLQSSSRHDKVQLSTTRLFRTVTDYGCGIGRLYIVFGILV